MKQYTSRELSEKLVKLGCKSQSGIIWANYGDGSWSSKPVRWHGEYEPLPAFEFEDFCGTHEQAHINLGLLIFYIQNKRNKIERKGNQVIVSGRILTSEPMSGEELFLKIIHSKDWLRELETLMEEI